MSQSRINVFVPPINNFPELILGGYALKDRVQVLPQGQGQGQNQGQRSKSKPSSTEPLEERELQYLYVIDSQGRLLEHMRYSGDYRVALREAFASENIVPSKIALNSQAQSDLKREPSTSNTVLTQTQTQFQFKLQSQSQSQAQELQ